MTHDMALSTTQGELPLCQRSSPWSSKFVSDQFIALLCMIYWLMILTGDSQEVHTSSGYSLDLFVHT